MKAYIQTNKNDDYYNVNAYVASVGFEALGFELFKYFDVSEIKDLDKENIIVGSVGMVRKRLNHLGISIPKELEYPEELKSFLNRKIWKSTLKEIIQTKTINIFIKPIQTKLFPGKVIRGFKDYIGLNFQEEIEIWCSELIEIETEWRCFIRYKEILDIRYYKGKWDNKINLKTIRKAADKYISQPTAYCLDFGIDKNGKYYLIEVNDGHSLGTYGMGAISYAKFLSARWAEMTETRNYLNF